MGTWRGMMRGADMEMTNRARGALVGMAVGEALGAPLEGLTREDIEQRVGRVAGFVHPAKSQPEHRAAYFLAGGYEDETQVALAAADVLIRKQGFRVEFFAERLAELGQPIEGKVFGCYRRAHRNLRVSVRRLLSGIPWREAGVVSAGSTAASRGIPIGIWYRDKPEERVVAAVEASVLTHKDVRACSATVAIAEATAATLLCERELVDSRAILEQVAEAARRGEDLLASDYSDLVGTPTPEVLHQFSEAVRALDGVMDLELDEALQRILEFAQERGSRPITSPTKGFALTGVISALYFFLTGISESFDETVLDAISEGGSSDTLGCLVGGLCGALHGIDGIPREWLHSLRNGEQVDLRGAALSGVTTPAFAPLVLMEAKLTRPAPSAKRRRPSSARRRPGMRGRNQPPRGRGGPPRPSRGGPGRGRPFGPPRGGGRRPERSWGNDPRRGGGYRGGGPGPRGGGRPGDGRNFRDRGGPPDRGGGYRDGHGDRGAGPRPGPGGRPSGPRGPRRGPEDS